MGQVFVVNMVWQTEELQPDSSHLTWAKNDKYHQEPLWLLISHDQENRQETILVNDISAI